MALTNQLTNNQNQLLYIIVKHAAEGYWHLHFITPPNDFGATIDLNAAYTYTGRQCNIPKEGLTKEQAVYYLEKLKQNNPSGGYDICPLING